MKIIVLEGGNFRKFIHFYEIISTRDLEILELIKKSVSRTEYKPFSRGYNKNVSRSFFYENNLIPAQFYGELKRRVLDIIPEKITIENEHLLYDINFDEEYFEEWLEGIILPPNFSVDTPEYIYQKHSTFNLLRDKYGRIEIGTGGGKTLICYLSIKYYLDNIYQKFEENNKVLLVIDRKDLIIQTKREFEKFDSRNIINNNSFSRPLLIESIYSGAKKLVNANVIIATWQSIAEYENDFFEQFKVFMCDEAHKAKAYSIETKIVNRLVNIEYSWGFTGTWQPYPTLDYISNTAMFGDMVYVKKTHELMSDGNVCDAKVVRLNINYSENERQYIKEYKDKFKDVLTGVELYHWESNWIQTHDKRNNLMIKLINSLENNHLILCKNVSYILLLEKLLKEFCPDRIIKVIHGLIPTQEREDIKASLETQDKIVLIATNDTMSTGVSINNLHYVHNPDGGKSRSTTLQGLGRALRKHFSKLQAIYFDYNDNNLLSSSYGNQAKERLTILQNEKHKIEFVEINLEERVDNF